MHMTLKSDIADGLYIIIDPLLYNKFVLEHFFLFFVFFAMHHSQN